VLLVPNAAIRFRATPEMMAQVGFGQRRASGDSTRGAGASTGAGGASNTQRSGAYGAGMAAGGTRGAGSPNGARTNAGMLWYVDKTGKLAVARVKTGLSDGQTTAITPRDSTVVTAGMQVIVGTNSTTASTTSSANPLQPQGGGRRGPGGF
jgi:hypothetical protein